MLLIQSVIYVVSDCLVVGKSDEVYRSGISSIRGKM